MKRVKSKWGSKTSLVNQINNSQASTSSVALAMRAAAEKS